MACERCPDSAIAQISAGCVKRRSGIFQLRFSALHLTQCLIGLHAAHRIAFKGLFYRGITRGGIFQRALGRRYLTLRLIHCIGILGAFYGKKYLTRLYKVASGVILRTEITAYTPYEVNRTGRMQ